MSPWLGISLVLFALGGMMGALHLYRVKCSPPPEIPRKLLHIGMGSITLSFPWLFTSAWPVITLATLATIGLLSVKFISQLKNSVGGVLHGVARESLGEIYFPIAVAVIFTLSDGNPILFCIPILILTLADAVAALIGVRYGQMHYGAGEGEIKSAEGSVAFFIVAFLSTHIPLLLLTNLGRAETLLISLTIGLLVALFEAIAWRGLDNLFIPLGAFVLLKVYIPLDIPALIARLGVVIGLVFFTLWWRRRSTLSDSGSLAAALTGYVFWAFGGWLWLIPPILILLIYPLISKPHTIGRIHGPRAILGITAAGMFWVFTAKSINHPELYYPFIISFTVQLGITSGLAFWQRVLHGKGRAVVPLGVLFAVPLALLWWWDQSWSAHALMQSICILLIVVLAVLLFCRLQPDIDDCPSDTPRWLRQGTIGAIASISGLIPLYLI